MESYRIYTVLEGLVSFTLQNYFDIYSCDECIDYLFLFVAEYYYIVLVYYNLFIHLLMDF